MAYCLVLLQSIIAIFPRDNIDKIIIYQLAGGLGLEPRLTESESAVLPLDDPPIRRSDAGAGKRVRQTTPAYTDSAALPTELSLKTLPSFIGFWPYKVNLIRCKASGHQGS